MPMVRVRLGSCSIGWRNRGTRSSPGLRVREQAIRLLRLHLLRSADALQLAAALEWAGIPPQGPFVTLDDRLAEAARREGFSSP